MAVIRPELVTRRAHEAGWLAARRDTEKSVQIACQRGPEMFLFVFDGDGRMLKKMWHTLSGDRVEWPMARTAFAAMAEPAHSQARAMSANPETGARPVLPFDPQSSSDVEILDAVAGRVVLWLNTITNALEEAMCPASDSPHLRLVAPARGYEPADRILDFAEPVYGNFEGGRFRACRLRAIVEVA